MNKTRSLIILTIMLLITISIGLYTKEDMDALSYDLAVIDKTKNFLFEESDNGLKLKNSYVRYDSNTLIDRHDTVKAQDGSVFWSTSINNSKNYLIRANTDLSLEYFYTKGLNFDTLAIDDQHVYTVQASNPIKLSKIPLDFTAIHTVEILNDEQLIPIDMLVVGDAIYILVMQIDDKSKIPTSTYSLKKLDKAFNMIEDIDLSKQATTNNDCNTKSNSSCNKLGTIESMEYFNGKFYFSETSSSSIAINEPVGSNRIWMYDVASKNMSTIKLNTYFPYKLHIDSENEQLVVQHSSRFVKDHTYTIISIKDYTFKEIHFAQYEDVEVSDAYFVIKNNHYYFMFDDAIYKYDISGNLIYKHDLLQYNMEDPGILF